MFGEAGTAIGNVTIAGGQAVREIKLLNTGTHTLQAAYSGDSNFAATQALSFNEGVTTSTQVATVAAADGHPVLAPQAIGSAYGTNFTNGVALADPGPLPNSLGGIQATITDPSGVEQSAPLFFVSPTQINFLTPNVASGQARVRIRNAGGVLFTGPLTIQPVSPGLFSANGDGKGVAAAVVVHVGADGLQTIQAVFACGDSPGSCLPVSVDLGGPSDRNFLVLNGSGVRNASKVSV